MLLSNINDESHGPSPETGSRHKLVLIPLSVLSFVFWSSFYNSSRLTNSSVRPCLVSAVRGAHRRVHEELEHGNTAVKILQDVFGELPKNTECEDETGKTELGLSDVEHFTLPD